MMTEKEYAAFKKAFVTMVYGGAARVVSSTPMMSFSEFYRVFRNSRLVFNHNTLLVTLASGEDGSIRFVKMED